MIAEERPRPRGGVGLVPGDAAVALALASGYVAWLVRGARTLGYARDEGFYFQAANGYGRWFEALLSDRHAALERRAVDAAWATNHEHPALIKSLFALSNLFLQKKHHLFAMEGTSYRFPAMILAGLVVALVYVWGTQARGRVAGLTAAALLATMPRFFFHAHLACFDVPIVALWTLGAYTYWRSLRDGGWIFPVLAGVCFGLALDTKHNSWFLPIACSTHLVALSVWALVARTSLGPWIPVPPAPGVTFRRGFAALAIMALLGPCVLVALWPWVWHDTVPRLREYVLFHLNHEYYNMEFLGRNYWAAPMPRGYAWVMTLATVPTVTLALFAVGLAVRGRVWLGGLAGCLVARARRVAPPSPVARVVDGAGTDVLWLFCVVVNYAMWLLPGTPIFGGTKHWMTAYPFLALFAGAGMDAVARAARHEILRRRRSPLWGRLASVRWAPAAILGAAVLAAPLTETVRSHPWGLTSYTPLVGGAAGAASLGLNRTFWGYSTGSVVDFLDAEAPPNGSVYIHDTAGASWEMLVRDGRIRRDIRASGTVQGSDLSLYQHEMHMLGHEYQNWIVRGTVAPVYVAGLDGVPVILVYEDPKLRARRAR
jgi:mRNA-degrading endonuclease HigB of HigAB toxin-antitoxin module